MRRFSSFLSPAPRLAGACAPALAVAFLVGGAPAAHAIEFVTNGSFETGAIAPFVETQSAVSGTAGAIGNLGSDQTNTNFGQPAGGARSLFVSSDFGTDTYRQTISLTQFATYNLAYDAYLSGTNRPNEMSLSVFLASVGGSTPAPGSPVLTTNTATLTPALTWTTFGTTFQNPLTSGNYDLVFLFTSPTATSSVTKDLSIDRISVNGSGVAVPEAGTLPLLALGLSALGGFVGTRRFRSGYQIGRGRNPRQS